MRHKHIYFGIVAGYTFSLHIGGRLGWPPAVTRIYKGMRINVILGTCTL
ncbi:MAG: hypothetical protein QN141_13470 [Armatimonadota bacterium]|nr:hypothetical protein [Armatimonadota bacterium]MDR7559486.1 hypothetical protein [Armatimonadota bacterium]